ncbi:kinase-like protein [Nemania sp. FL0031]|nr:kinase-like protein [Nemania sp. FL0031]
MSLIMEDRRASSNTTVITISSSYLHDDSEASALSLIEAIRPDWGISPYRINIEKLTGGVNNTLLKLSNLHNGRGQEHSDKEAVLLRAYGHGTGVLIDREREVQSHELLMRYGLAPELLARFRNGMLYRYIPGMVARPEDLSIDSVFVAVATKLAEWHAKVPCLSEFQNLVSKGSDLCRKGILGNVSSNIWTLLQKWVSALPATSEEQKQKQSEMQKELDYLVNKFKLQEGNSDCETNMVFGHCDLLSGNIVILPQTNVTDRKTVTFIDYEYAMPCPAAFDLANHFAEWGGLQCDYSLLPIRSQRRDFITQYTRTYNDILGREFDEEKEVARLYAEVDEYRGVPGFFWALWALIKAPISENEPDNDFDYASYAETRLGEYYAWKAEEDGTRKTKGGEQPFREMCWAQS